MTTTPDMDDNDIAIEFANPLKRDTSPVFDHDSDRSQSPTPKQSFEAEPSRAGGNSLASSSLGARDLSPSRWHPSKSVDVGFAIGIGFGFGQEGCELEELQTEYNRKVVLRITTHVLGFPPGSLAYDSDIREHMDLHQAAEISRLTKGAVTVHDAVSGCTRGTTCSLSVVLLNGSARGR